MKDRQYFENITSEEEIVARAICAADGCDPDQMAMGLGKVMPDGYEYPLWKARLMQARAAIGMMSQKGRP